MQSINCNGRILDLKTPLVMGILNITPDSFYDGGKHNAIDKSIVQAEKMLKEGASILDIGGMSSRPGANIIEINEEIKRILPIIQKIKREFPDSFISVDTFRKDVARAAFEEGADIINDISAGDLDSSMIEFVAKHNIPYIMMHMKGIPETMQDQPEYEDVIQQVFKYLLKKISFCKKHGLDDVIIDPGFGFGKTIEHNFLLLKNLEVFHLLEKAVLVGISRKSMIYKTTGSKPQEALYGTTAAHMYALQKGAAILRVHDVKAAIETLKIWQALNKGDKPIGHKV